MKKFFNEFKEFISRGNVMDLAVGVIIGTAFTAIVNSLVENIIMPFITVLTGNVNFDQIVIPLPGDSGAEVGIGTFINAVISFLLIAIVIFIMVKMINGFRKKDEKEPEEKHICPYCRMEVDKEATRCPYCTAVIPKGGEGPDDPVSETAAPAKEASGRTRRRLEG